MFWGLNSVNYIRSIFGFIRLPVLFPSYFSYVYDCEWFRASDTPWDGRSLSRLKSSLVLNYCVIASFEIELE